MSLSEFLSELTQAPRPEGRVTLETQVEMFDHHAEDIWEQLIESMKDPEVKAGVLSMARKRLMENYPQYGDQMFHESDWHLGEMAFEELADAVNWSLPIRAIGCLACEDKEECFG